MFKTINYKMTLKSLIPVFLIVTIIFSMVVFAGFYFDKIKDSADSANKLYLTEMSTQAAKTVNGRIAKDLQVLKSISSLVSEENDINIQDLLPILKIEVDRNSFDRMGIIYPNGHALTSENHSLNLGDRKYFKEAMKGKPTISDVVHDKISGNKINVYAVPIYQKSKIGAVLFATVDNDIFKDILSVPTFGGEGYSYIVKASGDVIVPPNKTNILTVNNIFKDTELLEQKELDQLKTDFISRKSNMINFMDSDIEYYLNYSPIGYNDWYIITITPKNVVAKDYDKIIKIALDTGVLIILLFLLLFVYITLLQNKYSKNLENIVFIDQVTGDNTWNYFKRKATKFVTRTNKPYAFLLFDIDKFKIINDVFGWEHGNQTLKFISKQLNLSLRDDEVSARVANDNFVVLLNYKNDEDIIKRIARFSKRLSNYSINPQTPYKLNFSCGVYRIPEHRTDFDMMHNKANFAKNLVKGNPESSYDFYDDEMKSQIVKQSELEREMHKALSRKDFAVYLQPKYSLTDTKIVGAEALVRWIHPEKGMISPAEFIPLFEQNGFIAKLDLYVFETVCQKIKEWIDDLRPLVTVSVNISRVNFHNKQLAATLYKIASKYEIPVGLIEIEITESAVFENIDNLIDIIKDLRMLGFPVSIDDFGTGYSSLNLLKDLEVDVLKLDREFFNFNKTDVERSQKVVSNVILMAKDLNIKTVSEGVETEEHVEFLKEVGCDTAQGYYFARPMPLNEFEDLLFNTEEVLRS